MRYTQSFPELSIDDFPKFEDFDYDKNELVSFSEWETYVSNQKKIENKLKNINTQTETKDDSVENLLSSIIDQ